MSKVLFWGAFGVATRLMQLGIEMRPFFQRGGLIWYPVFGSIGASFGWWLSGVEQRQVQMLQQRKNILMEKRKRRAEREAAEGGSELAATAH
ncbi:uncharacterized protein HMPREF1541_09865 [Cyphellophora europaea CBS 101466]|uniref:NADH-ubiquinone oxidoreductase 14 kDa subunit n=1 Tax=Cyphellophora europaea (strain CBS 101466) TaxID=1220924 RepID=W2SAR1_CYPE1|nr:uncharacterized protein HMPREF1541_09865 [Cyphellophora europaea CBS 101466]ETN44989.1 hypothetical protein HMPREF1541_09865 [Cyphellophora europaea CBS 101466]